MTDKSIQTDNLAEIRMLRDIIAKLRDEIADLITQNIALNFENNHLKTEKAANKLVGKKNSLHQKLQPHTFNMAASATKAITATATDITATATDITGVTPSMATAAAITDDTSDTTLAVDVAVDGAAVAIAPTPTITKYFTIGIKIYQPHKKDNSKIIIMITEKTKKILQVLLTAAILATDGNMSIRVIVYSNGEKNPIKTEEAQKFLNRCIKRAVCFENNFTNIDLARVSTPLSTPLVEEKK
jgi:hypothetical protein